MGKLKEINKKVKFVEKALRHNSGEEIVKRAYQGYSDDKILCVVTCVIVVLLCLGIMYLRFRVFGE